MMFARILIAEFLKLRRVALVYISFLVLIIMAAMLSFFMWITLNPGLAETLGVLGEKAKVAFGTVVPDWSVFVHFLKEMSGLGGMFFAAMLLAWVFGREYMQGTAKNLLVLPVPRVQVALAKILVCTVWLFALFAWFLMVAVLAGQVAGLGSPDWQVLQGFATELPLILITDLAVSLVVAFIAVASKGVFAPLGYAVGSLLLATMFAATGWGPYVPWSVVNIMSGAASAGLELVPASGIVVVVMAIIGFGLTILTLERADNAQ